VAILVYPDFDNNLAHILRASLLGPRESDQDPDINDRQMSVLV
jgi:hypothetical protein